MSSLKPKTSGIFGVRTFLMVCLFLALGVYTYLSVEKYFKEVTTISIATVEDEIELPSITICIRGLEKNKNMSTLNFDDFMKTWNDPLDFIRKAEITIKNKYSAAELQGEKRLLLTKTSIKFVSHKYLFAVRKPK